MQSLNLDENAILVYSDGYVSEDDLIFLKKCWLALQDWKEEEVRILKEKLSGVIPMPEGDFLYRHDGAVMYSVDIDSVDYHG